jgi:hypothetical protein
MTLFPNARSSVAFWLYGAFQQFKNSYATKPNELVRITSAFLRQKLRIAAPKIAPQPTVLPISNLSAERDKRDVSLNNQVS